MLSPYQVTKRIEYLEQEWASMERNLSDEDEREIRAFANDAEVKATAQSAQFSGYLYCDTVGQQMTGCYIHMRFDIPDSYIV